MMLAHTRCFFGHLVLSTMVSYEFIGEDHTLGNAVRLAVLRSLLTVPQIEIASGVSHHCAGLRLGVALSLKASRYMLMKSPDVEFAGYSVPCSYCVLDVLTTVPW
eukprot:1866582-Amphidinium_carterae.1